VKVRDDSGIGTTWRKALQWRGLWWRTGPNDVAAAKVQSSSMVEQEI
jgi:hypothetical protein